MEYIIKISEYSEDSGLLTQGATHRIENETTAERVRFLGKLLGTLAPRLLGNMLADKGQRVI